MSDEPRTSYYQILGVPRSATEQQIRAAYRALAVRCHPDTSAQSPATADQFKQLTEAYEVLSDPDKRRRYDREDAGLRRGTRRPPYGRQAWQHPAAADPRPAAEPFGWSHFLHSFFGDDLLAGGVEARARGSVSRLIQLEIPVTPEEARYGATVPLTLTWRHTCAHCSGSGRQLSTGCGHCHGQGSLTHRRSLSIPVPGGVRDGSVLRFQLDEELSEPYEVELRVRIRPCW